MDDSFSFSLRHVKQFRITRPAQSPGVDHPQQNRFTRAQLHPDALTASAPHCVAVPTANQRALEDLHEHDAHREIQPHDRIRRRPDDVPDDGVAAVDYPSVGCERRFNALREIRVRRPVRAPVQFIEFDVRKIQARRELPR